MTEKPQSSLPLSNRRYLALGDSYTAGESVAPEESLVSQLVQRLNEGGVSFTEVQKVAKTSWTTSELGYGIESARPQGPFDLVTLCIGVNNQFRGRPLEEYRVEFRGLLAQGVEFAGNHANAVIVLSIPDWGVLPYGAKFDQALIARQIDDFNQANRAETLNAGAHYVDITPISRREFKDPAMVASDGLHPSGKQYALWVTLIKPLVEEILGL